MQPADDIPRPGGAGMCQFMPDSYVPVGGICGGGTPTSPICESGLRKEYVLSILPVSAMQEVRVNNRFRTGQFASLICVDATLPLVGPPAPGYSGMCQFKPDTYVQLGGICGGGTPTSPVCETKLVCLASGPFDPKAQGNCYRQEHNLGDLCQLLEGSIPCKAGFVCVNSDSISPNPFGYGKCQPLNSFATSVAAVTGSTAITTATAVTTKLVATTAPAAPTSIESAATIDIDISITLLGVVVVLVY
ncbi:hypothetical protein BCR33DRAFT_733310 [Rhizoclosmatium globosum]|uniref:Uncharacterized protein n=1 Tax=Rhizoclosmatium globosum TaxID=329046 RepID=A0A1Y2D051_9FUNG|nr:hypothetical protein BCR33DRAFT_733310 [Rhizoclosmatium globosum]|eukprot:ORY52653.1 hypothetical protein BCR33DRAFT_733310 [Rhizoclosmatium globosum]